MTRRTTGVLDLFYWGTRIPSDTYFAVRMIDGRAYRGRVVGHTARMLCFWDEAKGIVDLPLAIFTQPLPTGRSLQ